MPSNQDNVSKASILCVEASRVIGNLYRASLESRDYILHIARTGADAMDAFANQPADLVITELSLPDMDGVEWIRHLRRQRETYDVPIIVVSSQRTEEALRCAFSAGADDYLIKPVTIAELVAKLENLLNRRRATSTGSKKLPAGTLFAGRYEVESLLGYGGHSAVYAVRDVITDPSRLIVCKVFDIAFYQEGEEDYLSLFLREAYEHSRLRHKNIVEFIDFGQAGGKYFLIEEYLRGLSVSEMVAEQGPLKEDSLLFIGFEIADALVYLASNRIIHRDIKPGNIMVTHDGQVKLLDFGLARKMDERTLSLKDEFMGTPHFCSPEYIRAVRDLDARTDVYSLGVTLYWAATGQYPVRGDSPLDILEKQLHLAPTPLIEATDRISRELSDAVGKMLGKDRTLRPGPSEARKLIQNLLFKKKSTQKGSHS